MSNFPTDFMGSSAIAKLISRVVFKFFPFEFLSVSAKCIARKFQMAIVKKGN